MSTFWIAMSVAILFCSLLVTLPVILVWRNQRSTTVAQVAPAPTGATATPAPTPATTGVEKHDYKWWIVSATALVGIVIWSNPNIVPNPPEINWNYWWVWTGAGIIILGSLYGWYKGGGWGAVWVGRIVFSFILIVALYFAGGYLMFGSDFLEVYEKFQGENADAALLQPAVTAATPETKKNNAQKGTVTVETPKWAQKGEDGTLPVGVWSNTLYLKSRCMAEYDAGNGIAYKVQTRLYDDWEDHIPGTINKGNELRIMILKEGLRRVPVTMVCPN